MVPRLRERCTAARGGQDAGITQPRDHSLADSCEVNNYNYAEKILDQNLPNSPLRPCFKKLFDVVQMYGKDVQAAGSTSRFLLDVARQNAEMTINLQRAILNNKQRR